MDSDPKTPRKDNALPQQDESPTFCWKEALDQAFTGWEPADQSLEKIIDRAERRS